MESKTHRRVVRATRIRIGLRYMLLVSLVLHVLMFPAHLLHGMLGRLLFGSNAPIPEEDQPTIIPIDLMEPPAPPPPAEQPAKDDFAQPTQVSSPAAPMNSGPTLRDAGSADVYDAASDAHDVDAHADSAIDAVGDSRNEAPVGPILAAADASGSTLPAQSSAAAADAATDALDAGSDARTFKPIADPIALAGSSGRIAQAPHVQVAIFSERIQRHPLAAHFGPILARIPQWDSFFAGTNIDPIRDTKAIWLAGPQFRNSSRVSVLLQYKVPDVRIEEAVNAIARRSGARGHLLEKRPNARIAKGVADHADRLFVLPGGTKILVVVPPDGEAQALNVKQAPVPQNPDQLFIAKMHTPRNGLVGFPLEVPDTLRDLSVTAEATADNGADLRLDVVDTNPTLAAQHARKLTEDVDKLSTITVFFVRTRLFDPIIFYAEGNHIRAQLHMTPAQLRTALSSIAAQVDMINRPASSAR